MRERGERRERDRGDKRERRESLWTNEATVEKQANIFALILHKFSAERKKNLAKRSERVLLVFKY